MARFTTERREETASKTKETKETETATVRTTTDESTTEGSTQVIPISSNSMELSETSEEMGEGNVSSTG